MGPMDELQLLLDKVRASEDLVQRCELYFYRTHHLWSGAVASYFQDWMARKKDQIHYEWARIEKLGHKIAADRLTYIDRGD